MKTTRLPRLKKTLYSNVKYKLSDTTQKRRNSLEYLIKMEMKLKGTTLRHSALKKQARLNVLRIYRKNGTGSNKKKLIRECKRITSDMKWIAKHYKTNGQIKNICGN